PKRSPRPVRPRRPQMGDQMRIPLGSSPTRLAAAALAVAAAFSLVGAPAQAAPDRSDAPPGHAAHIVTLPSGDQLSAQTDPTGRLLLSPVRPGTAMETRTLDGDVYAFPVAAMRAQGTGFDPARYDVSALLRGEKTAPAAVHPDFPMRTLTLNVTDDQGQPS